MFEFSLSGFHLNLYRNSLSASFLESCHNGYELLNIFPVRFRICAGILIWKGTQWLSWFLWWCKVSQWELHADAMCSFLSSMKPCKEMQVFGMSLCRFYILQSLPFTFSDDISICRTWLMGVDDSLASNFESSSMHLGTRQNDFSARLLQVSLHLFLHASSHFLNNYNI